MFIVIVLLPERILVSTKFRVIVLIRLILYSSISLFSRLTSAAIESCFDDTPHYMVTGAFHHEQLINIILCIVIDCTAMETTLQRDVVYTKILNF